MQYSSLIHSLFINQENGCNSYECSLINQTLSLLYEDHQFEYYKSEDHYSLTWSLTTGF